MTTGPFRDGGRKNSSYFQAVVLGAGERGVLAVAQPLHAQTQHGRRVSRQLSCGHKPERGRHFT